MEAQKMKEIIIDILKSKQKTAEIIDGGYYAEVVEEDDFEVISDLIIKSLKSHKE